MQNPFLNLIHEIEVLKTKIEDREGSSNLQKETSRLELIPPFMGCFGYTEVCNNKMLPLNVLIII